MRFITRTVLLLSFISLFNDVATEMLYPVMPVYLKSIGFSVLLIGILEGIAEAIAGLSKGYFGKLSDRLERRAPFIQLGYTLSAVSKPVMAFFIHPLWVFSARTMDRLGKGVRTGARDAMLSGEAEPGTKGKVFGFHRMMDTFGAVLGPILALIYLHYYPGQYQSFFLIAFFPGLAAIALLFLIRDKNPEPSAGKDRLSFFAFIHYWKEASPEYRKLLTGLLLFALFNSSDFFLLLKMKEVTHNDSLVIKVYIFYNIIYALSSWPLGALGDKLGLKTIFIAGLLIFAVVYAGAAFCKSEFLFYVLFFLYGIYAAATEGISKAWISNTCEKKDTATAIGTYAALQSICIMLSSFIAGFIWLKSNSPAATFLLTAAVTLIAAFYLSAQRFGKKF